MTQKMSLAWWLACQYKLYKKLGSQVQPCCPMFQDTAIMNFFLKKIKILFIHFENNTNSSLGVTTMLSKLQNIPA